MSSLNILPHLLQIFSKKQLITDPAVSPTPCWPRGSQYPKLALIPMHIFLLPSPLMQLERLSKRSQTHHNLRGALYHNRRGSPIPLLKSRPPPPPQLERSLKTTTRKELKQKHQLTPLQLQWSPMYNYTVAYHT